MSAESIQSAPTKPRVRFAPSPTGELHLGSARTALFNWLYARRHGGAFILRIEDTDLERSKVEIIERLLDALRWLGLEWDEGPGVGGDFGPYLQSERIDIHQEHVARLIEEGKAYECYMTSEELDARRAEAIADSRAYRYEGWHRELTRDQIAAFQAEGRKPAIRLRVEAPADGFLVRDLVKGDTRFPAEQIDDFILLRSDGTPSFHLANVVDDALMQITHVIRGEDHLVNTIRHQVLFDALGYDMPAFAHLPMILGEDRSKLSKRHGAVSVTQFRDAGFLPDALVNELALLGWSSADGEERFKPAELARIFDLDRCSVSASIFDVAKLEHFNGLLIREMSTDELLEVLKPYLGEFKDLDPDRLRALVELLYDSLVRLADFGTLAHAVLDEPDYTPELLAEEGMQSAGEVCAALLEAFCDDELQWERAAIKKAIKATGKATGIKGKALFFPLRAALTGVLHGASLDGVAAVLGRETSVARLRRFVEAISKA